MSESQLDVMTAIYRRRAIRSYLPEQIQESAVVEMLDAAVHAPTALHREPWAFVVVQDRNRLRQYSDRAKALLLGRQDGESLASAGSHTKAMLEDPNFNIFYDASTLVVVGYRVKGPFVEADCWLAAENLMLAAIARGLGTCCIGFAVDILNAPDVKRELGIPEGGAAIAPIIVGRPRTTPEPVSRKPPEILSWAR